MCKYFEKLQNKTPTPTSPESQSTNIPVCKSNFVSKVTQVDTIELSLNSLINKNTVFPLQIKQV